MTPNPSWHNNYPLDTFHGETKKELIYLIQYLRERAVEEYKEKQDNGRH